MPRQLTNNTSAFTQFKKCLFRIEIAQEVKYNVIKQNLLEELAELERERAQYNEDRAILSKVGSKRRKNKELIEIDRLNAEYEAKEALLHENEKHLIEERKNNAYDF